VTTIILIAVRGNFVLSNIVWVYEKKRETQYRHNDLACLFSLHSLRSYSFLFSLLALTCLYALVARAKHSCSLCLLLFWSLPYHILSTHRLLSFFFFLSVYSTINTTTSSFVRLLVRQHFEKKRAKKKRTDKLK
jgi:hypothetical protein